MVLYVRLYNDYNSGSGVGHMCNLASIFVQRQRPIMSNVCITEVVINTAAVSS